MDRQDSYERPASILWDAIANTLRKRGWTDEQIGTWLRSKATRRALDAELGDKLRELGDSYANVAISDREK